MAFAPVASATQCALREIAPALSSRSVSTLRNSLSHQLKPFNGNIAQLRKHCSIKPLTARRPASRGPVAVFGTASANKSFYDFTVKDIEGKTVNLGDYKGKVVLVVNVASQCGFTPQYKGLQEAFSKFKDKGFTVLAFPCNQFGSQEPGSNQEIRAFAARQGATFPVLAKVDVNGASADPVWNFLKDKQGGLLTKDIKWNFTKFLVDKAGNVVKRYGSTTTPEEIEADIKAYL